MIRRLLRQLANRQWLLVILAWIAAATALLIAAPSWDEVALEGDLDHLPADSASVRATELMRRAFPDEKSKSEVVLVFSRSDRKLSKDDREHILKLAFELEELQGLPITDVLHAKTPFVKTMLFSPDEHAQMVIARLSNPIMAVNNIEVRDQLEALARRSLAEGPAGIELGVTGSAAIGADTFAATRESLKATHRATLLLVLVCLVVIYRSPLVVFVPLVTIGLSVLVSSSAVALLAQHFGSQPFGGSVFKVFTTTKVFIVVILFGAGTDYCLFLISRYREELQRGVTPRRAPGIALRRVSGALAGSAFTTILGLGVMAFADYGKFASSGPVIGVCLLIALLACVTFAPALLRALGPRVFWPARVTPVGADPVPPSGSRLWTWVADAVIRRPASILTGVLLLSTPLVVAGWNVPVNYDLLSELPPTSPSLAGADVVRHHFGEGWLAPMRVIVRVPGAELDNPDTRLDVALLHNALYQLPAVRDVRSPYLPPGGDPQHRRLFSFSSIYNAAASGSPLAIDAFVSSTPPHKGQVMRLSLLLEDEPFSQRAREAISQINHALEKITTEPQIGDQPNPWRGAEFQLAGATPGMADLERVTGADQRRIQVCCVGVVYLVLLLLTRRPLACAFLIATVLLSYLVTIGATELVFQQVYGDSFQGLDWKAPLFLFVILVAVGQDYNIYLTTRILEEQRYGQRIEGLRKAIQQTGGIITSCGVIMAGTFVSMMAGSLRGMVELGFALALGVLLDTFVVRTILVPCYFALHARLAEARQSAKPAS